MANVAYQIKMLEVGESFADVSLTGLYDDLDLVEAHIKSSASRLSTAGGRAFGSGNFKVNQICTLTADRSGIIHGAIITRLA